MSMVFMDGCDHYNQNSTIELKWTVNNGCTSTSAGRNGRGISIGSGFIGRTLEYSANWVIGFAVNFQTTIGWGGQAQLYELFHAGDTRLAWTAIETDGTLTLKSGNNTIANSGDGPGGSTFSFHPQSWYYVEFKTNISVIVNPDTHVPDIAISMAARVNGTLVCSGGPIDSDIPVANLLLGIPSANFHRISAGGVVDGLTTVDDIGIADINGVGSVNDFFGDIRLGALFPIADVQTDWTPSRPGPSWNLVNEQFPDGDTTYVSSFNPGDQDVFTFQEVDPFIGTIVAVHYGVYARKDDEGTRSFQLTCNGHSIGQVWFPGDTYVYYFVCLDTPPGSGSPWTIALFNAAVFGVNLIS